jgi:hypothetical protein
MTEKFDAEMVEKEESEEEVEEDEGSPRNDSYEKQLTPPLLSPKRRGVKCRFFVVPIVSELLRMTKRDCVILSGAKNLNLPTLRARRVYEAYFFA